MDAPALSTRELLAVAVGGVVLCGVTLYVLDRVSKTKTPPCNCHDKNLAPELDDEPVPEPEIVG